MEGSAPNSATLPPLPSGAERVQMPTDILATMLKAMVSTAAPPVGWMGLQGGPGGNANQVKKCQGSAGKGSKAVDRARADAIFPIPPLSNIQYANGERAAPIGTKVFQFFAECPGDEVLRERELLLPLLLLRWMSRRTFCGPPNPTGATL